MPADFEKAHFDFFSKRLSGVPEMRDRSDRGLKITNTFLGELLGKIYVEQFFPTSYKEELLGYIPSLKSAFQKRLENVKWMDNKTKEQALKKLNNFGFKIGYPDQWRDYSALVIKNNDLIGNYHRAAQWHHQDALSKLAKPRRTWEWQANPQEINAFYYPSANEIIFPAAILQPPFFDAHADPAVNFGAIGAVIGHEMVHAFDDQGSRTDYQGTLKNWWTEQSRQNFDQRANQLISQYNQYEPIKGTHVNGQLTLGENIGDLGGIIMAFAAFQDFKQNNKTTQPKTIEGFSPDQLFFLSWAQVWREKQTDDFLIKLLLTDPHSPGEFRTNGTLRNFEPWYKAFNINNKDALYIPPDERVVIW